MENKKELVTIVIPVYNVEKYLEKCIISTLEQDYENIEIILIDDGSTDNSLKICERYAKESSKIKVIRQENKGVSVARNNGIKNARGKWICFVDSDDYIEKDMVSSLVKCMQKENSDIIITPPILEYNNESKLGKIFENEMTFNKDNMEILELNIICRQYENKYKTDIGAGGPWGKLYNTEFLKEKKLEFIPGLKRMQDVIFNLHVTNKAEKIVYTELFKYHYRINNNSVCLKYNPYIFEIFFRVINEFEKFIKDNNKNEKYYQAMYLKVILMYIEGLRISVMHEKNDSSYIAKIKEIKKIYNDKKIKNAFKSIKFKNLNMKMKIFTIACRMKMFYLAYLMIRIFMKTKKEEQK